MISYIVVKHGVYMQGVWGPFDSFAEAIIKADELAAKDTDSYHTWEVKEFSGATGTGEVLYSINKTKALKKAELGQDETKCRICKQPTGSKMTICNKCDEKLRSEFD